MRDWKRLGVAFLCLVICAGTSLAADVRSDFLKLIDRARVPADPKLDDATTADGIEQRHFSIAADARHRVPGIVLKSVDAKGRAPVVILLHGTGGAKESQ